MSTLGDAHKKLLVLSQPGGLREFVYPAMKVSRTEVGLKNLEGGSSPQ